MSARFPRTVAAATLCGSVAVASFGSTTGGLWVSENQGDTWTGISHTLPPIYAVRFT